MMLSGWSKLATAAQTTAETMDKASGTALADKVNAENLHHTQYATMDDVLQELTTGAENLMKQRDQYIEAFRKIALSVDMKAIPANDKMSGIETSARSVSDVANAVYNFKNRRDNLVNAIAGTGKIVGVTLNSTAMRNDNDPGKSLGVLNTKLKSMNDQLDRYKSMASELSRLSGGRASVGDSVSDAVKTTDAIKKSFNDLQAKLNATQNSLKNANREIAQLKNTVSNRDSNISNLNRNLAVQKEENTVLKSIIAMDEENVEQPWKAGSDDARKEVIGKVLEVNERFGIVVVDLGSLTRVSQWLGNKNSQVDPKIEKGMKLNIVRNFDTPDVKLIVKGAEITNVADRCSVLEVPADDIANIKVGDSVIIDFVK